MQRLQGINWRFATWAVLALVALVWALVSPARAHDIPADVKINAFFKPSGDRLELLVRLPLASLIDTDFPTRPDGTLDIARAEAPIRDGTKVWLTDNIDVYRGRPAARQAAPRRRAGVDAVGQILRLVRGGARPRAGATARRAISACSGARFSSTCCSNIRSSRTVRSSPSTSGSTGSAAPSTPRCGSSSPTARSAPSSFTAPPVSSISIRAGTRRCCGSWSRASGTSSTAPTISCFSPASSSRCAGCGR